MTLLEYCTTIKSVAIFLQEFIKKAITAGKYGQTLISKDFLEPGEDRKVVKRGAKSKRRRCDTIYMEKIDQETSDKLKKCTQVYNIVFPTYVGLFFPSVTCPLRGLQELPQAWRYGLGARDENGWTCVACLTVQASEGGRRHEQQT